VDGSHQTRHRKLPSPEIHADSAPKSIVSPWQNALYTPTNDSTRWIPILKLLIQYGADVHAYIEVAETDDRRGVKYTTGRKRRRPYHHLRKSALLVLQEYMAKAETADAKSELLEVTHMLEKKGAKAKKYWAQKPGAPCVFEEQREQRKKNEKIADSAILSATEDKPSPTGPKSTKVQESSPKEKEKQPRRIRRYLRQIFPF
jgi:hypothetical protein